MTSELNQSDSPGTGRVPRWPVDPAFSWPALVVVAVSAAFLYLTLFVWPDIPRLTHGDQYINFDNARRMAQGQHLYTDIFQYTLPGTEWLYYGLIRIFGARLIILNTAQVVTGSAMAWLGLVMAAQVIDGWPAMLPPLLFVAFGLRYSLDETHHKFSVLLAYAALAVLVRGRGRKHLAAAGLLAGMAICFTQTLILLPPALAAFVLWEDWTRDREGRRIMDRQLRLLLPCATVVALVCGWMIGRVGFSRFWYLTVDFPLKYYPRDAAANTWAALLDDRPNFFGRPTTFLDWLGIKLMIPLLFPLAGIYLWRRRESAFDPATATGSGRLAVSKNVFLILLGGVVFFATIGYAPDIQHLTESAVPAFVILVWWLDDLAHGSRLPWMRRADRAACVGLAAASLVMFVAVPLRIPKSACYLRTPAGMIADGWQDSCRNYTWLLRHVSPGQEFFRYDEPISDVILGARDPVAVPYFMNNGYVRERQVKAAVKALARTQPRYIVGYMNPDDFDDSGDRMWPFGEFLRRDYRLRKYFPNNFQVWESRTVTDTGSRG